VTILIQSQVLQIAEALLKQSDLLTGSAVEDLPYISPTARFLDQLAEHFSIIYEPGQVRTAKSSPCDCSCHATHKNVSGYSTCANIDGRMCIGCDVLP